MTGSKTSADKTTTDSDNKTEVKVKEIYRLRVIIYYTEPGDNNFKNTAKFLEKRLKKRYPLEKRNKTMLFAVNQTTDFIAAWEEINTLSKDGQHVLKRVHFIGHGGQTEFYFQTSKFSIKQVVNLAQLNWSLESVLVLHSCKGGHEYSSKLGNRIIKVSCIAREFSKYQKTRVFGQMVSAHISNKKESKSSAFWSKEKTYLWGYCSGDETVNFVTDKDSVGYNLYSEYKKLADSYNFLGMPESIVYRPSHKIWPCQAYFKGEKVYRELSNPAIDLYFM